MSTFFGRGGSSKEQAKEDSSSSSSPNKKKSSMQRLFRGSSKSQVVVENEEFNADASFRASTNSNSYNNTKRSRIPKALWSSATNPTASATSRMRDDSSSSNGGKQVKRSSMSNAGNFMTNTLMAPVVAGKAVVQGSVKAGAAVGNTVSNSVAFGSKAGMAVVAGTSNAVSKGAKGMVKGIKNVTTLGNRGSKGEVKSKWEEGIEVIDSILDTSSEAYKTMSNKQRKGLIRVKKLLIDGTSGADKTQHIPRDLIQLNKSNTRSSTRASIRASSRTSTKFLIEEYGGVNAGGREMMGDLSEWDDLSESDEEDDDDGSNPLPLQSNERNKKTSIKRSLSDLPHNEDVIIGNFVPVEFKRMSKEVQMEVYNMLSWDNLKKWDFDIFALNTVTRRRPLMFAAWAIIGSPYSQKAMAHHMGLDIKSEDFQGYPFMDELMIPPNKLLDYFRVIELDYHAANPYHNAIHAADVIQTLHTLIQFSLNEDFLVDCPNVKLFTILLAAAIHDVDHPGKLYSNCNCDMVACFFLFFKFMGSQSICICFYFRQNECFPHIHANRAGSNVQRQFSFGELACGTRLFADVKYPTVGNQEYSR